MVNIFSKFAEISKFSRDFTFIAIKEKIFNWITDQLILSVKEDINSTIDKLSQKHFKNINELESVNSLKQIVEFNNKINNLSESLNKRENLSIPLNNFVENFDNPIFGMRLLRMQGWPKQINCSIYFKTDFLDFIQWDKENHEIIVFYNTSEIWNMSDLNRKIKLLKNLFEERFNDVIADINTSITRSNI